MRSTNLAFTALLIVLLNSAVSTASASVPQRSVHEVQLTASGQYENPYTDLSAEALITDSQGRSRTVPLFWDGGQVWKFRISPDRAGEWRWTVKSADAGLSGRDGTFQVVESDRKGSIMPMADRPHHFQREDGSPFWFLGDTAWALYTDIPNKGHDGASARRYLDRRASQGFNVIHSMLLSEAGHGNEGGLPFDNLAQQQINPSYWREVDQRLAYLNSKQMVAGLVLAWGDKQGREPFAWRRFPDSAAKKRYATYIGARYGAYDAYFIIAGEWLAEAKHVAGSEPSLKAELIEIGDALATADPHDRMIGMHSTANRGSVSEFVGAAKWMSFGDYQQNYRQLHARILEARKHNLPVVNSEYAYHVRISEPEGSLNKPNSFSTDDIRHASWDIATAGGYLVTGFGSTYFGGLRNKGQFELESARNKDWEDQVQHLQRFFTGLDWTKLVPADHLITADVPRTEDRKEKFPEKKRSEALHRPPVTTYWAMTGKGCYVMYVRGLNMPARLSIEQSSGTYQVRQFDPRTGSFKDLGRQTLSASFDYTPPDENDWIVLLEKAS